MIELIDAGYLQYCVSDKIKCHEWIFNDGIYVVNPNYLGKFLIEHGALDRGGNNGKT